MWICLTAKDSLDSLSYNCPCIIQIFLQFLLVKNQFTQALQCTLDSNDAMTERHTDVTEYGTVSKVALQAANRKFLCQELKNGIGYAQVTFTVLIIDRIHLVRHRT